MARNIDYGNLMHRAMRGLIKDVLSDVARDGLPGEHHFFITFDTRHPEVRIAAWLSERYPSEMTVVMQHWYDALDVAEDGFSVTLNFGNQPEPLYIPYDAIKTFVDPSVEFGLRFEPSDGEDDDGDDPGPGRKRRISRPPTAVETDRKPEAEVVPLDRFRK